jgi:hypothetical protein
MLPRHILCLGLCILFANGVRGQNVETRFPTDDEIRLVITQAQRAVAEYKPLVDRFAEITAKEGQDAVAKDRETIHGIDVAIVGFGKDPQAFNGPLGFAFFQWLDDACRNALLSSLNASNTVAINVLDQKADKAQSNAELAKDFMNVSTLFYTVSENAGALYMRYVEGEERLARDGLQVAQDCAAALKQKRVTPKE